MTSLKRQLAHIAAQLEHLNDTIPVDEQTMGVTLERHSPGNGSTYTRLRAPKGMTLANGKRTMSLSNEEAEDWKQKIAARNQQAKVVQCLLLVQQAKEIAASITWELNEDVPLVDNAESFTKDKAEPVVSRKKAIAIKYVLKDAKGANTINRKVHAVSSDEPEYGRWFAPALCGEQPKASGWGWRRVDSSELSCPKCYDRVQLLT